MKRLYGFNQQVKCLLLLYHNRTGQSWLGYLPPDVSVLCRLPSSFREAVGCGEETGNKRILQNNCMNLYRLCPTISQKVGWYK